MPKTIKKSPNLLVQNLYNQNENSKYDNISSTKFETLINVMKIYNIDNYKYH